MPSNTSTSEVKSVTDFVLKYGKSLYDEIHRPYIESFVEKHFEYGTILVVKKRGNIVAVCRWNFPDRNTVKVLDLIIHPEWRNKSTMKAMLVHGVKAYPWLKYITFSRKKHNYRNSTYLISDFLKMKES